jgi:SAM-dependent methyltransferase
MGTYYKALLLIRLGVSTKSSAVLDVGGLDGHWLSQQDCGIKVCLDLSPVKEYGNTHYIQGDALKLPLRDRCIDQSFAFDVMEHVSDDELLVRELLRVVKNGGKVTLSVPNKKIRIFPSFLTNWVSRRWGHNKCNGYLEEELESILPRELYRKTQYVRAFWYRLLYFPLRLVWGIVPQFGRQLIKAVACLDGAYSEGDNGYLIITIAKNSN